MRDSPNTLRVDGNGTVTDTRTGLVWQRTVDDVGRTPSEAKAYCEQLSLDGAGWRVPAISELESIVDFARDRPTVDPNAFPETPQVTFVSSSAYMAPSPPGYYWYVQFGGGLSGPGGGQFHVRCVRSDVLAIPSSGSGGVPPDRYDVKDNTVRDTRTGLTWQQHDSGREYPWQQAETYCRDLTLAGGGWRLPTISELLTIVDRARAKPALDPASFGTPTALNHWSGSRSGRPGSTALWGVGFQDGSTFNGGSATSPAAVRCVR